MASRKEMHRVVLRSKRELILEQSPEPRDLLADPRLSYLFTKYEREEILRERTPLARVEKLISVIEWKGAEAYGIFVSVLREYRPSLVEKIHEEERAQENSIQGNLNVEGEEDAGILCFNELGPGPLYHISCISYSGRQLLGDHLNQPKELFQRFCLAFEVPQELTQRAQRSGNPTGYLIQEMTADPNATMERLETALDRIEKKPVYDSLISLLS